MTTKRWTANAQRKRFTRIMKLWAEETDSQIQKYFAAFNVSKRLNVSNAIRQYGVISEIG